MKIGQRKWQTAGLLVLVSAILFSVVQIVKPGHVNQGGSVKIVKPGHKG